MNEKLTAILASVLNLPKGQVRPDLTMETVGKWDSLTQMDLVTSIEEEFSLTLEIADIVKMTSVAGIVEVLREHGVELED